MAKLTDVQRKKLPPELQLILERFHHEPRLLMQMKHMLSGASQKVAQHALNHKTFCDRFLIPNALANELLKLYGISEKEMKHHMEKIGFAINQMYTHQYYQTLCLSYLVGLEFDDHNITKLSMFLIAIRIWNGRKMKAFPRFCDPDVAKYVTNYELQGNHTYLKGGSLPFEFLDRYNVPAMEKAYHDSISNNLDSFTEGLRKLIEAEYNKIVQLFRSMKDAYYRVHKEGKKEVYTNKFGQNYTDGDMVETKESFSGNIERLVDKIEKNAMLKRNVLMKPESVNLIKSKFNVSTEGIKKWNNWIEDEDNSEELRYFYELLFTVIRPNNEGDVCKIDVPQLAKKITSARREPNLLKAKEILEHMMQSVLGPKYKTLGGPSLAWIKLASSYALIIHMKIMLCKTI